MSRLYLAPDTGVRVGYDDDTPFGSPVGTRPEASTAHVYAGLVDHYRLHGMASLVAHGPELLGAAVDGPRFGQIAERRGSAWELRPEVLYPDPALAPPRQLSFYRSDLDGAGQHRRLDAKLPPSLWPAARVVVGRLANGGCDPLDPKLADPLKRLLTALSDGGLATPEPPEGEASACPGGTSSVTFVGHNTIVVRSPSAALAVDPFLFPRSRRYPEGYQPLRAGQLGALDAVLLTHSHPDHFDPGSLLQFPPGTPVVVPAVDRETLLAVDLARRLEELGVGPVLPLAWGERRHFGDLEVTALPFYGEQPTDGDVLHPSVRNAGNTYVVRTPTLRLAVLADSGRDHLGDVRQVAEAWHAREGAVDLVFSGYRGWATYPVQLAGSSVGRFLLFVPPWLWGARMRLMNDVDDALDAAERWGAGVLVPCADGGAPWHWSIGLGPRLDGGGGGGGDGGGNGGGNGSSSGSSGGTGGAGHMGRSENPAFDPFPERQVDAARRRLSDAQGGYLPSPVTARVLRPGDTLVWPEGPGQLGPDPRLVRLPGHAWCYREEPA